MTSVGTRHGLARFHGRVVADAADVVCRLRHRAADTKIMPAESASAPAPRADRSGGPPWAVGLCSSATLWGPLKPG